MSPLVGPGEPQRHVPAPEMEEETNAEAALAEAEVPGVPPGEKTEHVYPTLEHSRTVVRALLHPLTREQQKEALRLRSPQHVIEGGKLKPDDACSQPPPVPDAPRIVLSGDREIAEAMLAAPEQMVPSGRAGIGWHFLWSMHALPSADYPLHNRALPAFFAVAGAFARPPASPAVDFRTLRSDLQLFAESCRRPDIREAALELLQKSGLLRVIPEVHWRVDRPDFLQHLGFSQEDYMRDFGHPSRPRILLELGAGNGAASNRRKKAARAYNWSDFSIDDCAYYPLSTMLRRLIDFERLEADAQVTLTEERRTHFCDVLYKILVIRAGEASHDRFAYDEDVQGSLNADVDSLVQILARKAPLMQITSVVPGVISKRDHEGKVYYPNKVFRMNDNAFENCCALFARRPETYLRATRRLLRYVPLRVPGKAFADFDELDRLQDASVDLVLARRSTVYKRGQDYVKYLTTIMKKVSGDGLLLDDGFRDNDGWRYRFPELLTALLEMEPGVMIKVIMGPPFPGEDHLQGDNVLVPLGIAASRDPAKFEWLQARFPRHRYDRPLFELRDPLTLCGNPHYLRSLDAHGGVVQETDALLTKIGSALE